MAAQPDGRFSELEATRLASSMLRGLAAVHSASLVHRDLKPSNIALRKDDVLGGAAGGSGGGGGVRSSAEAGGLPRSGECSLLDFGLARAEFRSGASEDRANIAETLLELTQRGGPAVGTPHYMAPEAWLAGGGGGSSDGEHGPADGRADLWAVGVILFRMLTGKLPFADQKQDLLEVWQDVTGFRPAPDAQAAAPEGAVSRGVAGFVARALCKRPEDRYQSAAEMQAGLYAALVQSDAARYGGFISYRVRSDAALALALHSRAGALVAGADGGPVVYLDKVALVDGARWDRGFLGGLGRYVRLQHLLAAAADCIAYSCWHCRTDVFVPLISVGALEPLFRLKPSAEAGIDPPDNVLLEYTVAVALFNAGRVKAILPVLAGKPKRSTGAFVVVAGVPEAGELHFAPRRSAAALVRCIVRRRRSPPPVPAPR